MNQELCKKFASIGRQDPIVKLVFSGMSREIRCKGHQKLCQTLAFEMFKGYPTDFISRYETCPKTFKISVHWITSPNGTNPRWTHCRPGPRFSYLAWLVGCPQLLWDIYAEDYLPLGIATYLQSHPDAVSPLQDLRDHLFDPSMIFKRRLGQGRRHHRQVMIQRRMMTQRPRVL